jgi:hypothetical protein
MGINPNNEITIIIRILFAVTLFQQVSLYQSENINTNMILRDKKISTEKTISDSITRYLMKVTRVHDQLVVVGEKVANE